MLKQKLILSYSTRIFMQFFQVVASIIVARIAGPTVLGTVAFGTAYVSVFSFIADLGIATAHIKLISDGEDIGKCTGTFAVLKLGTTLLFVLAVLGFFAFQYYIQGYAFESPTHLTVIFISLITLAIDQILFIPKTTFAANTEQAKVDIPDLLAGLLLQFIRVAVVFLGFGAIALAIGNLFTTLLTVPVFFYLFRKINLTGFDKKLAMRYLKIAFPVIFIGMSTSVVQQIDKVLLQFFSSSEQVGYYTAGYKVGGFILLIGKSVGLLFFPLFSKAVAAGDTHYIKDKIEKFERFSLLFIMPAVILVTLLSETIILAVLSPQYLPAVPVMQTATIAMFLLVLHIPYANVLTGMGKFNLSARINMVNLIVFTLLIVVFASPDLLNMGAMGVAIAVLISYFYIGIIHRWFAKKAYPELSNRLALRFAAYGCINLVLAYILFMQLFNTNIYTRLLFIPAYGWLTYTSLYMLGWINRNDWQNLLSLVDIKSMRRYISKEMVKR